MSKPCDTGMCCISRCPEALTCTSLTEDEESRDSVVESSKTLPQHVGVAEKEGGDPAVAEKEKTKKMLTCGEIRRNKLLWMKGGWPVSGGALRGKRRDTVG
jgi:hypothetical protein